jgi:L-cysteine:1D-myo-inositol 2-amino-2-deoxy-alpha-D-glucopyranoside ligase
MPRNAERLANWCQAGQGSAALDDVRAALDEDLDTPAAVAAIDRGCRAGVGEAAALLGVDI